MSCTGAAACSGSAIAGGGNWAGIGFGEGAWWAGFYGWAVNGAITTLGLWSSPVATAANNIPVMAAYTAAATDPV